MTDGNDFFRCVQLAEPHEAHRELFGRRPHRPQPVEPDERIPGVVGVVWQITSRVCMIHLVCQGCPVTQGSNFSPKVRIEFGLTQVQESG